MPDSMEIGKKAAETRGAETYAGRCVHMIGIGGAGMRALAEVLLGYGAHVSGSDITGGSAVEQLTELGAAVCIGQRGENIPERCDLVVYSAAVNEQNPELLAARQRGVEVVKYSQMLGRLMAQRLGIAVSGTHGKSTTTAMVAYALKVAGAEPSFVVGAIVEQLGGPSGVGAGRHFVAEACEFDRSFLNLRPHLAAILNIEEDHLDCYEDISAIVEAFRAFASQVAPEGVLVANGEDRNALAAAQRARCEVQTFGLAGGCTWRGVNVTGERGMYRFDVELSGKGFCRLELSLAGLHNVYNALAATALLHSAGMAAAQIARHLGGFLGARRRMTLRGCQHGVTVVDDYAHHPTEIQVTLKALREQYSPRRLLCVFQPHQHSRTRFLLKDFARSFAAADEVIVPDIYFVRDSAREKDYISSEDLVAQIRLHGGSAAYLRTFDEIVARLGRDLQPGDLVVTMGAGDIWKVADGIISGLA
ncbi:MAG TPA: UDP-N-acetylmuramate--L-alanine ligase [Phycisphaerae bacterium]|nr:UDP-N-acetylmuramate--L-alanine ligase [Phycisphaerae bacterium]